MMNLLEFAEQESRNLQRYKKFTIRSSTNKATKPTQPQKAKPYSAQFHWQIENFIDVVPKTKTDQSIFVLDIYSQCQHIVLVCDALLSEVNKMTKGHKLVLLGAFRAPHTTWGYHRTTKKCENVYDTTQHDQLSLWNDSHIPTRIGNSVSSDTNRDLTFTEGVIIT